VSATDEYPVVAETRLRWHRRRELPLSEALPAAGDPFAETRERLVLSDHARRAGLTTEEWAALVLSAWGLTTEEIGFALRLAVATVKRRRATARAKLDGAGG
jgi:DNA-binding NarL/FixJ family response regulator